MRPGGDLRPRRGPRGAGDAPPWRRWVRLLFAGILAGCFVFGCYIFMQGRDGRGARPPDAQSPASPRSVRPLERGHPARRTADAAEASAGRSRVPVDATEKNTPTRPALRPASREEAERMLAFVRKLRPLQRKLAPPGSHDWLAHHREPGETFAEYAARRPVLPRGRRSVIYIQPLGDFTETQRRIVDLTAEFMGRYFVRPVKLAEGLPLSVIPERARRVHPSWGDRQILTTYVLDEVLRPRLPGDAAAYLALTASDLWPGRGWNFVYGQASLRERVGVWSICRNGDPEESEASFRLCLLRTLKTATHETGHMFSMRHCVAYECNMCGSNHREESDRRPIALCPECVAKVAWGTGADLVERYRALAAFAREHGLATEAESCEKSIRVLTPRPGGRAD